MNTILRISFAVLCLFALPTSAATYIVPPDAWLVDEATSIVSGRLTSATSRFNERGAIETVYTFAVDEVLKGDNRRVIELVEWGGRIGNRWNAVAGGPRYDIGSRYLLFVESHGGSYRTSQLCLGRFEYGTPGGRAVVTRDSSAILGWNVDGTEHREVSRDASRFEEFIRMRVRGGVAPVDYFLDTTADSAARPTVSTLKTGSADFPGYDFDDAAQTGVGSWSGAGAGVAFSISGSPATGNALNTDDGEERIIEEDPNDEIAGTFGGSGVVATAFMSGGDFHNFEGRSYITITGSDVITQNGVRTSTIGQSTLRTALVHEIGHTLGFRHSNASADNQGACSAPLPCSSGAIMNSAVGPLNGVLQSWDLDAVQATYGSGGTAADYTTKFCANAGCTAFTAETGRRTDTGVAFRIAKQQITCNPPSIATQPPATTNISLGQSTQLTVAAAGTGPFTFAWFVGDPGTTTQPIGTNSATLTVSPTVTTTYWVRVTNCSTQFVNSSAATVFVSCASPNIVNQPGSTTINEGNSVTLQVGATGSNLTYQWYIGPSGDARLPVGLNSPNLNITPTGTTQYWVRVSGACGTPVDSQAATVTVIPCAEVEIDAPTSTPNPGIGNFRLNVNAFSSSTPLQFQWFRGTTPGFGGTFIASTQAINVSVTAPTSYWARVTNGCGKSAASSLITVAPCTLPSIATQPEDRNIVTGNTAALSLAVNGSGTTVKWYRGAIGDRSNEVGAGTSVTVGPLFDNTTFWAELTNTCGTVASRLVTVTVDQATTNLFMLNRRFNVQVRYRNQFANPPTEGLLTGRSLLSSTLSDTAIFWFDSPLVVELMVRVSDARPFDNAFHVYLGGLSDVEFFITVKDTVTGKSVEYHKLPNSLVGQIDRKSFPTGTSLTGAIDAMMTSPFRLAANADTSTLRMLNRYDVRIKYRNQFANPASEGFLLGRSITKVDTTETAVFYFENPESVEWMVRFSDVRPFANRVDFFHGGLSDVEYTVLVKDLVTGVEKSYPVLPFSLAGGVDRQSFTP